MSKTNGKLKFDLALSTTSVYDASSIYVNKSAELSINGNANLNYKTIGSTYAGNGDIVPSAISERPGPEVEKGSSYIYIRNLGGSTAPSIRVSTTSANEDNTEKVVPDGTPVNYDGSQIMDIHPGEFAFFPYTVGEQTLGCFVRAAIIPGSTYWTGATYTSMEYGYFGTDVNEGPKFGG